MAGHLARIVVRQEGGGVLGDLSDLWLTESPPSFTSCLPPRNRRRRNSGNFLRLIKSQSLSENSRNSASVGQGRQLCGAKRARWSLSAAGSWLKRWAPLPKTSLDLQHLHTTGNKLLLSSLARCTESLLELPGGPSSVRLLLSGFRLLLLLCQPSS